MDWTDWEEPFLEKMAINRAALTTRQAEKLLELRDAVRRVSTVKGFSVRSLLGICWEARLDLDEDGDVDFLNQLKTSGSAAIRNRDAGRLMACARKLRVIET
jgi:hypothetical protein